jgi:4-hydroxy-4-methyl-2-oxoglutarate aldolase
MSELPHLRKIYTSALVSDALDALGWRNQVLGYDLVPMSGGPVLVGRAFPVRLKKVERPAEVPYAGLLAALDAVGADEVFVLPTARATDVGFWGELLSTSCQARGVAGALTDGPVRDTARVHDMGFTVFGRGTLPADINGRYEVVGHRVEAQIDEVMIHPGDIIVGDVDGVVIVPKKLVDQVTAIVEEKSRGESAFRAAVRAGIAPSVAFAEYGVL